MVKAGADEWREYLRIYGKKSVRVVREKAQAMLKARERVESKRCEETRP